MILEPSQFTKEYFKNLSWFGEPLLWRTLTEADDLSLAYPGGVAAKTDLELPSIWLDGNCGKYTTDPQGHTLYVIGRWTFANEATGWTDTSAANLILWYGWPDGQGGTNWTVCPTQPNVGASSVVADAMINLAGASSNVVRIHGLPAGQYRITAFGLTIPEEDSLEIWVQRNR